MAIKRTDLVSVIYTRIPANPRAVRARHQMWCCQIMLGGGFIGRGYAESPMAEAAMVMAYEEASREVRNHLKQQAEQEPQRKVAQRRTQAASRRSRKKFEAAFAEFAQH
jgi:hypothetical protein